MSDSTNINYEVRLGDIWMPPDQVGAWKVIEVDIESHRAALCCLGTDEKLDLRIEDIVTDWELQVRSPRPEAMDEFREQLGRAIAREERWPCETRPAAELPERLVAAIYVLLRQHVHPGDMEDVLMSLRDVEQVAYSNPHLEALARAHATFLLSIEPDVVVRLKDHARTPERDEAVREADVVIDADLMVVKDRLQPTPRTATDAELAAAVVV